jgi:two-component system, cell cycle sensor histidine kinase and response regulator CckA
MGIFTAAAALLGKGGLQDTQEQPQARHRADSSVAKSTVLIIDDDPSYLDTMRALLRGEGYNVLTSSTGPKGLDMVRYAPRDIGAVLLDFNMPRFNGAETLQFLRKLCPDVKVLAVSGVNLNQLPPDFRAGVDRFIPKPFSNEDLLKTIEEVIQDESATDTPTSAQA